MFKKLLILFVAEGISAASPTRVPAVSDEKPAQVAETVYDIVVYGGTSAGVVAAIQAREMDKSVVLIEPSDQLGGLTSGGLGQTDIGNKAAIGGLARQFYQAIRAHYSSPEAWTWQRREEYKDGGQTRTGADEDAMWTFEPSVALKIFETWVKDHQVDVIYGERLDRRSGVAMTRSIPWRILSVRMESGRTFHGRMFIDATYEGDLMAAANVSYTVGREANSIYGETLNGVQTRNAKYHQFVPGVDPYVEKGNPASGLLPFIDPNGPGAEGAGDQRVQAYCFRMCLTDHPDNRIPFHKPASYDPLWYELLLRNFEAGESGMPWINSGMPNRKTDTNNRTGFSTDFIGQNHEYSEASYDEREQIVARHRLYQKGLMWTLANHPRVPEHIRHEVARWGMCKDEFAGGNGWQDQLYVREARRMVSDYVMTQHHCQRRRKAEDSVGLAAYGMDSHNVQRYVDPNGHVRNEGDVEVGGFSPYPISYRSIVPRADQCANLLVPVCLSASHIAYGSIRMEPVFMVLGQSAATAAVHAIDEGVPVHRVDGQKLRQRFLSDGQILEWVLHSSDLGWTANQDVTEEFAALLASGKLKAEHEFVLDHTYRISGSHALPDGITISAVKGAGFEVTDAVGLKGDKPLLELGDGTTLRNLTITYLNTPPLGPTGEERGVTFTTRLGIQATGKRDIRIENCRLTGSIGHHPKLVDCRNPQVISCHIAGGHWSVYLIKVVDAVFRTCLIEKCQGDGIKTGDGANGVVRGVLVEDCVFQDNLRDGIDTTSGFNDSVVRNCIFNDCIFGYVETPLRPKREGGYGVNYPSNDGEHMRMIHLKDAYAIRYRNTRLFGDRITPVSIDSSGGTKFLSQEAAEAIEPTITGNIIDEPAPRVEPGVTDVPFACGPRALQ